MNQNPAYAEFSIGDWTYGGPQISRQPNEGGLRIGRFCSFGSGVTIMLGSEHYLDRVSTYPFHLLGDAERLLPPCSRTKGNVEIGHDVWVGNEAMILSGVTIGNGAVIGARSVVTHDVPPYAVVAGVPARIVRYRLEERMIAAVQMIAWWDWPVERIREAAPLLMSPNIEAFLQRYGPDRMGTGAP